MTPLNWLFTHTSLSASWVFQYVVLYVFIGTLYWLQRLWRAGSKGRDRDRDRKGRRR